MPEFPYHTNALREKPVVALTFDDGPNPPRTEQILGILAAHKARASFFFIGKWVERWPRTVERVGAAGHCIGNHSYEHVYHVCDYDLAEAAISHVTGKATRFVRAAAFDYEALALTPLLTDWKVIDADVNPADWMLTDPAQIADQVLSHPSLGPGSIIDLHESSELDDHARRLSRPTPTIAALDAILVGLRDQGLSPVTLEEMEFGPPLIWRNGRDPDDSTPRMGEVPLSASTTKP